MSLGFLLSVGKVIGYDFSDKLPRLSRLKQGVGDLEDLSRQEGCYADMLEKYVDLFVLTSKMVSSKKESEIKEEVINFLKSKENLPWQGEER